MHPLAQHFQELAQKSTDALQLERQKYRETFTVTYDLYSLRTRFPRLQWTSCLAVCWGPGGLSRAQVAQRDVGRVALPVVEDHRA